MGKKIKKREKFGVFYNNLKKTRAFLLKTLLKKLNMYISKIYYPMYLGDGIGTEKARFCHKRQMILSRWD